jgi:hypothetical protein
MDRSNTWILDLDDLDTPEGKCKDKSDTIHPSDHISGIAAKDSNGTERYFFFGGQLGEDEPWGNHDELVEYSFSEDKWYPRQSLDYPRGHTASSTRAYGCGFLTAGGSIDGGWSQYTDEVSYYDIKEDQWTNLGTLPSGINTPVSDIREGYLYCQSGNIYEFFSYRHLLVNEET